MKKLIEESGKSLKEFAEFYEIPYNTVRQWYNGERTAAPWIKKLIEKAAKGKQLEIPKHYITTIEIEGGKELGARIYPAEWIARKKMNEREDISKEFKQHLYAAYEIN